MSVLSIGAIAIALVVIATMMPKKPTSVSTETPTARQEPRPPDGDRPFQDRRTLRQRQIDEDAALLSDEFAQLEDARYRDEVRARAARAFATPGVSNAATA